METLKRHTPNALTLLRIVLGTLFAILHFRAMPLAIPALLCILIGCITDYFDGFFARLWKVTSDLGKILDAYADKYICWLMTFAVIGIYGPHSVLVAIVIVQAAYDIGLTYLRYIRGQVKIPVNGYAKWKTTTLMSGFILLYAGWILKSDLVAGMAYMVLILAIVFALASIATYLRSYKLERWIPYPFRLII